MGHIKYRGQCCILITVLTQPDGQNGNEVIPGARTVQETGLFKAGEAFLTILRSQICNIPPLFLQAFANGRLITVFTVPIFTSKCLLLPPLPLPCVVREEQKPLLTTSNNREASLLL